MPDQISVSEFIAETTEDYNSPTTSSFTTRLHNCRNTVTLLEEVGRSRSAPQGPAEPSLAAAARPAWHLIAWIPEPGMFGAAEPHPLPDPRSR
ncbi:Arf-GAP with SH3 domain, ANK repeat and PH domain-containing protein 1 [Myotis brandtii]|uniref:Arf-GAP with SH3 domain, ANK repeat and PH domain-containing protein 1 n=1 Tax=Myotis brandtii TaxID=109478 RepID=S7PLM3_MYOBR|nr:Arf-GAP with SH3 domain, ANK repeat and PH domain-containing protein 1 [Myotis brandtii]